MMKKDIISSTLIYSLLTFVQPAVSFLILPILLAYFTVEEYGIYSLINTFSYFLGVITAFRVFNAIHSYYFDYRDTPAKLQEFMGAIISFTVFSGIVLLIILCFFGDSLFELVFKNDISFFPYGLLGAINGILLSIVQPFLTFLRNEYRTKEFTTLTLILVGITLILQVTFIIGIGMGILGALLGRTIALVIVSAVCLYAARKVLTFKPKWKYLKEALLFSLPLIPFSLVAWVSRYMDRYIIENMADLETLGIYTLLITICLLIIMANDGMVNGVQPFLFNMLKQKNPGDTSRINRLANGFILVLLLVSSSLVLVFGTIEWWLPGSEFIQVLPFLGIGAGIYSLYSFYSLFKMELLFEKKTHLLSIGSTIYAFIYIGLLFILVPRFGIWGALVSNLIGFLVLIVVTKWGIPTTSILQTKPGLFLFSMLVIGIIILPSLLPQFLDVSVGVVSVFQFVIVTVLVVITNRKEIKEITKTYIKL